MTEEERNDRREGYADGMAGVLQFGTVQFPRKSQAYDAAWAEGLYDADMLAAVAEFRRRNALPEPALAAAPDLP